MIKSMTGIGTARTADGTTSVTVEIKSLNSKFLDIGFRLPKSVSDKELEIRNLLNQTLERGKLNVSVDVQVTGDARPKMAINHALLKAYYRELHAAATELGASATDIFRQAVLMPDVLQPAGDTDEQAHTWTLIDRALREAIRLCDEFRIHEGAVLAGNLLGYVRTIGELLHQVELRDPERTEKIRTRIRSRVTELVTDEHFDPNRFEQEMIYYLEKLDISEEKVRLRAHLDHFTEALTESESPGKKLNFIAQELGREINTIGSKANDVHIQRYVVAMKEELEKIKEQSANIL